MSRDTPFVDFPAGSTMLREGESAGAIFIIEAGRAGIERNGQTLAELGPGDVFGEAALLQERGHATNAVARTAVRALRLDAATLPAVLRENVEVAMQLMRRLTLRLRAADLRGGEAVPAQSAGAAADAQVRPERADQGAGVASAAPAPASPANVSAGTAGAPSAVSAAASASAQAREVSANAASASAVAANASNRVAAPAGAPPAGDATAAPGSAPARAEAPPPARTGIPAAAQAAAMVAPHVLRHAQGAIAVPADQAECLVGRPDPATGAIPEINLGPLDLARSLSRRHARLLVAGSTVSLREEPGVANGTWVNGERLAAGQTVSLKPGDKLRFGAIELEFGTA